ncbi:MAG: hypothetical protein AB1815_13485 [Bacillota bacterium]
MAALKKARTPSATAGISCGGGWRLWPAVQVIGRILELNRKVVVSGARGA